MYTIKFNDQFNTSQKTGKCYLNFNADFDQKYYTVDTMDQFTKDIDSTQITITAAAGGGKAVVLTSKTNAMCFSFGVTDYSNYTRHYTKSCDIKTFVSEGKTYVAIIKKDLLQGMINSANEMYQCVFHLFLYLYKLYLFYLIVFLLCVSFPLYLIYFYHQLLDNFEYSNNLH